MAILGLITTESFAANRFTNIRRMVFYFYPNGAAPLVGLLSLLDSEETNDPKFSWWEKRLDQQRTTTATNTTGSFITNTGTNADASDPFTTTDQQVVRICVTDASKFRPGHQIKVTNGNGAGVDVFGTVAFVYAGTTNGSTYYTGTKQGIDVRLNGAYVGIVNGASIVGLEVWVVGNVAAQGATGSSDGWWNQPINVENYTQIYRTPFTIAGSALRTSLKYDETGPYKDKAKEASIQHMTEIEKSMIFGRKNLVTNPASGLPEYNTAGILYFLQQWELGTVYGNTAATVDTDDNKRLIANSGGTMSERTYDGYLERLFRVTNNKTNEKLCLCGSGFLMILNQMYRNKTVLQAKQGSADETYGMSVVSHMTSFGIIHYRTHPLFSANPIMRFNGLFLDVHNLRYRFLMGRDTDLLKSRQPNDADYRKDEWMTEAGQELRFPESHMYLQNMLNYSPST